MFIGYEFADRRVLHRRNWELKTKTKNKDEHVEFRTGDQGITKHCPNH